MFLTFWEEYSDFFIILMGIIIGMILAYIIIFKPNNGSRAQEDLKNDTIEDLEKEEDVLSFKSAEEARLDDEMLPPEEKDLFVLGENSNILESLSPDENSPTKIETQFLVDDDRTNINDFYDDDDDDFEGNEAEKKNDKLLKELDKFKDIDSFDSDTRDPEVRLNRIIRDFIPLNDYANQNIGKYHVLFRKEDKRWYVKREGKDEIEKFLYNQKEAIAYATIQALIYATTVVVHDEDGKIAKYEF
ncbi:MAG: DUF2188 domain-containing protein [Tenericutes bacterium]|nr:DUF2188 domain-containing protein [Mycoplasmatota bacterium]